MEKYMWGQTAVWLFTGCCSRSVASSLAVQRGNVGQKTAHYAALATKDRGWRPGAKSGQTVKGMAEANATSSGNVPNSRVQPSPRGPLWAVSAALTRYFDGPRCADQQQTSAFSLFLKRAINVEMLMIECSFTSRVEF